MSENANLKNCLLIFSIRVMDFVCDNVKEEYVQQFQYQKIPAKGIDYSHGSYYNDWSNAQYIDMLDWTSKALDFLIPHIIEFEEYKKATEVLSVIYEIDADRVESAINKLYMPIVRKSVNGVINRENIEDHVELFITNLNDLKVNKPTIFDVEVGLKGIYLDFESVEIAPGVILRRPCVDDLVTIIPAHQYTSEIQRALGTKLEFRAILSFTAEVAAETPFSQCSDVINPLIDLWLNCFRLFKPSSVVSTYHKMIPRSLFVYEIDQTQDMPYDRNWKGKIEPQDVGKYRFFLEEKDLPDFVSFVANLKDAISGLSHTSYLTGESYELAYHRYNDALMKSEVNAYRILSSITSLEALLSDGSTEITFKIRLRTAKLLSYFGFNAKEVFDRIKDAYALRSKLVHGANPKNNLLEFARKYTHEILNINRVCLLTLLQIKDTYDKEKIAKALDLAMIDRESDRVLEEYIHSKVQIPIIDPFKK